MGRLELHWAAVLRTRLGRNWGDLWFQRTFGHRSCSLLSVVHQSAADPNGPRVPDQFPQCLHVRPEGRASWQLRSMGHWSKIAVLLPTASEDVRGPGPPAALGIQLGLGITENGSAHIRKANGKELGTLVPHNKLNDVHSGRCRCFYSRG